LSIVNALFTDAFHIKLTCGLSRTFGSNFQHSPLPKPFSVTFQVLKNEKKNIGTFKDIPRGVGTLFTV